MNFIIGLTIAFIVKYFIIIWSNRNRSNSDGYDVLKLPSYYGHVGVIGLAIFTGIIISALQQVYSKGISSLDLVIIVFSMYLAFLWLGIILILWTWVFEIRLNEEEIVQRSMLGKLSLIKWRDVKDVSFNSLSLQVTITDGEKKIKCHQHSEGFEKLVQLINAKLKLDRQQLGIPEY